MKWIVLILSALLTIAAGLYVVLFTPPGNRIVAPLVEKKLQATLGLPATLTHFTLGTTHFEAAVTLTPGNVVEAAGNYSLFSQKVSARYRAKLDDLASLAPLTQQPLQGTFFTEGNVTGTFKALRIEGNSDVASSRTTYRAAIDDYNPKGITLTLNEAKIADLLFMTRQPAFADGLLSLSAAIAPLTPEQAKGTLRINVAQGTIDTTVMQKAFGVTLPQTRFNFDADADIAPQKSTYALTFASNLAQVRSEGSVSPGTGGADLTYDIRFEELGLLTPLTQLPLRGPFATKGSVKGDRSLLTVEGTSDAAGSLTSYHSTLREMTPASVTATVKHAQLDKLLYLGGQDALASGTIDADIDLKDLDPDALKGSADIVLTKGALNRPLLQKRLNITLPDTPLGASLHVLLNDQTVTYVAKADSSLGLLDSSGKITPRQNALDVTYALNLKELGLLQGMTGLPLRGPFSVNGTLKGDKERLAAVASSTIAGSDTHLQAVLKAFKPVSAVAEVKHLKLKQLLYTLGEPLYADASIDVKADLPNLTAGKLDGKMTFELTGGRTDKTVVAKAFDWPKFGGADFSGRAETMLKGDRADTTLDLTSDLMTLHAAPVRYLVADGVLTADYTADLPDLDKLYFLTERHMRGSIKATGDLRYDQTVTLNAEAKIADGNVKARFKDKQLHADLQALKTLQLLQMLTYPEIFDGTLDGTVDYGTATKKGTLKADLAKGYFQQNTAFDLLRQYSTVDMYKEEFTGKTVARIDDKRIDADLSLRSKRTSLTTEHAKIDTAAKTIDADVHVDANNNPIDFRLKGSVNRPKVSIDAGKLIEREAGKQINRLLDNLFK